MSKTKFDRSHIERLRMSGLSISVYCKEHGVSMLALLYHLTKEKRIAEQVSTKFIRVAPLTGLEWFALQIGSNGFRIELNIDFSLQAMLNWHSFDHIYIRPGRTDMRKAINGLVAQAEQLSAMLANSQLRDAAQGI